MAESVRRRSPPLYPPGMPQRTSFVTRALGPLMSTWLPVVAWAALIFALSAQPDLRLAQDALVDFVIRKTGHMAIFGILALMLWLALVTTTALRAPWAWALAITVLYAITDELHQGFVAGRSASAGDVGIDAIGAVLAVAVGSVLVVRSRTPRA